MGWGYKNWRCGWKMASELCPIAVYPAHIGRVERRFFQAIGSLKFPSLSSLERTLSI